MGEQRTSHLVQYVLEEACYIMDRISGWFVASRKDLKLSLWLKGLQLNVEKRSEWEKEISRMFWDDLRIYYRRVGYFLLTFQLKIIPIYITVY